MGRGTFWDYEVLWYATTMPGDTRSIHLKRACRRSRSRAASIGRIAVGACHRAAPPLARRKTRVTALIARRKTRVTALIARRKTRVTALMARRKTRVTALMARRKTRVTAL